MKGYTHRQIRLLIACFVAYTAAYISRTNLSPALDAIQSQFGLTAAQVGLLPTLFAIPYAAGQVVNGTLADRFKAQNFILFGLLGSAAINVAFSLSQSYAALLVLWCLNGCAQSMIWTPMVRIMAQEFQDEIRPRAMFFISMTLIVGYLCAWALSGLMTSLFNWRAAFRASGSVTAVLGVGSFLAMRDHADTVDGRTPKCTIAAPAPVKTLVFGTDLFLILICCVFNGYVRDSIMNWAPKMLIDTQGIDLGSALGVILIIPVVNFLGIQFGKIMYGRLGGDVRKTSAVTMALCAAFSLVLSLFYQANALLCTAMLGACSAMSYALNPLLTSFFPMEYSRLGRVAMAAGLIDALIYVGSAFSGACAGLLRDLLGWSAVFGSWTLFSLVGTLMVVLAIRKVRSHP